MGLRETLQKNKLMAMKEKNGIAVSAITAAMTKVIVAEKSGSCELPLSDDFIQGLIQKEIKECEDSRSFYKETDTQYENLTNQIEYLKTYLPQPYTELEVESMIVGYIAATEETNAGKITGAIAKMVGTRFDKKLIKGIVERVLKA
jgi:uncharacterized protein YqeY